MPQGTESEETLDSETSEILKELEVEGHELAPTADKPAPKPEAKPEEKKPEAEKPKEEAPKAKEEEDKDKKPEAKPADRTVRAVPVHKFNEQRHELQDTKKALAERDAKIAELEKTLSSKDGGKPTTQEEVSDIRKTAKAIAEKHGLDEEFVSEFADAMVKLAKTDRNVLPKDISDKLAVLDTLQKERAEQTEERMFNDDFDKVAKEFPALADKKDSIKEIAYTEGNERIPLRAIAIQFLHDNPVPQPKGKTAEDGQPGAGRDAGEVIDFDHVTEEQMKDPNFPLEKFMEFQEKKEAKARGAIVS